jgi:hypothetical protein
MLFGENVIAAPSVVGESFRELVVPRKSIDWKKLHNSV